MFNLPAKNNLGIIFPENNFSITSYTTFTSFSDFYRLSNMMRLCSTKTCTELTLSQTWRGFSSPWPIQTLLIWITFGNEKLLTPNTFPLLIMRVSWKGLTRFLSNVRWWTFENLYSFYFGFWNFNDMFQCNLTNSGSCNCNKEDFYFNNFLDIDNDGKSADRRPNLIWYETVLLHCPSNTTICSTYVRRSSVKTGIWSSSLLLFSSSIIGYSFNRSPIAFCVTFSKFYQSWFHLTCSYPWN